MTLTASQVEASMAGNYTCKPYNSWGSSGTSTVIRVVVEEQEETEEEEVDEEEVPVVPGLPRLVGAWVDVLEVEVGQQVRLECQAEGEPHPEVTCCVFFVLCPPVITSYSRWFGTKKDQAQWREVKV